jgi:hypothetical protein
MSPKDQVESIARLRSKLQKFSKLSFPVKRNSFSSEYIHYFSEDFTNVRMSGEHERCENFFYAGEKRMEKDFDLVHG